MLPEQDPLVFLQIIILILAGLLLLLVISERGKKKYFRLAYLLQILRNKNQRLQKDIEDVFTLYEGIKSIAMTLKSEESLRILANMLQDVFKFTYGVLYLFSEEGNKIFIDFEYNFILRSSSANKVELDNENLLQVIRTKRGYLLPETTTVKSSETLDEKFSLIVPMIAENRVRGIIRMDREGELAFPFTEDDLHKLSILCAQIAILLRRTQLYEEVNRLAISDGLTGVYVHRYFQENLSLEVKRAVAYKETMSLLMIDIDYFKKYNDLYGHLAGDEILRKIAAFLKSSVRETDIVARYGGEEFAIILLLQDKEQAKEVAERIRAGVENISVDVNNTTTKVTISIGVASLPDDGKTPDELLAKADKALYEAKQRGRNCVVF